MVLDDAKMEYILERIWILFLYKGPLRNPHFLVAGVVLNGHQSYTLGDQDGVGRRQDGLHSGAEVLPPRKEQGALYDR